MNSDRIKILLLVLLLGILGTCGRYGWEPVDVKTEPRLNVMAVLALDDSVESVVVVHRTLDTKGPSFIRTRNDSAYYYLVPLFDENNQFIGYDTVWNRGYIDSSLYLVPDADVRIQDDQQEWRFTLHQPDSGDRFYAPLTGGSAAYYSSGFEPQPNTTYTLSIHTPAGLTASGTITTPPVPVIRQGDLADTLSIKNTFSLRWQYAGNVAGDIAAGVPYSYWDEEGEDGIWICGSDQYRLFHRGDTTWTSAYPSFCIENADWLDPIYDSLNVSAPYEIRLRYFDENYYRYFMVNSEGNVSVTNFLLGAGNIGTSEGIEGGFGVFGAFSTTRIHRILKP